MSYVPFATPNMKSFISTDSHCGTDSQNQGNCSCPTTAAGQMTNSSKRLTMYLGLRPTETNPPTLDVTAPGDNVKLPPSFVVTANASDDTAMDQVDVLLNNATMGASTMPMGTTYTIPISNVPEGNYMLEVQAIDLAGNITKKDLAVTIALGAVGDTCLHNEDCHGNVCAQNADGSQFCTQQCDDATNTCPDNFACEAVGAQNLCVPSSGGGCTVAGLGVGTDDRALIVLVGLSLGLVVTRRRRRA